MQEGKLSPWKKLGMFPIKVYQCSLAYLFGGHCRFTPTCSHYAMEAVAQHGVLKGWWLTLCRIGRCQPLCRGGYDPVPPTHDRFES